MKNTHLNSLLYCPLSATSIYSNMCAHWNCLTETLPNSNIIIIQICKIEEKEFTEKKATAIGSILPAFSKKTYVMCAHLNCLIETLPMSNTITIQMYIIKREKNFLLKKAAYLGAIGPKVSTYTI